MSATTTIPVTVTSDAQARIDELGRQAEFDQMIEHIRATVPELVRIDLEQYIRDHDPSPPGVSLTAWTDRPWAEVNDLYKALAIWQVTTFPPELCEHCFIVVYSTQGGHAS